MVILNLGPCPGIVVPVVVLVVLVVVVWTCTLRAGVSAELHSAGWVQGPLSLSFC